MKMPKWLTRIEFVNKEYLGFWEWQGWSNTGIRQTAGIIDDPHNLARISGATFVVTGYALGDISGVSKVEFSTDGGGHWEPVEIFSNPHPSQVWAFWKYVWKNPAKGKYTLKARAYDGHGKLQSSTDRGEWPDGATGYHTIEVTVA
jgi:DMSO/TMAO reductase YedYZ molybdopterin-dependent catalytic subunit